MAEEEQKRHAVELGSVLKRILKDFDGEPQNSEKYEQLRQQRFKGFLEFHKELTRFMEELTKKVVELPGSPGREEVSEEEKLSLLRSSWPVWNSYKIGWKLMWIMFPVMNSFNAQRGQGIVSLKALVTHYTNDVADYDEMKNLSAWLYRRTGKYQEWAKEYYQRPEVKKRQKTKKRTRPSRRAEAERQRALYWRKKGVDQPPPKRGKDSFSEEEIERLVSLAEVKEPASLAVEAKEPASLEQEAGSLEEGEAPRLVH